MGLFEIERMPDSPEKERALRAWQEAQEAALGRRVMRLVADVERERDDV